MNPLSSRFCIHVLLLVLIFSTGISQQWVQSVEPKPHSGNAFPDPNITIKLQYTIDPAFVTSNTVRVFGVQTGCHIGSVAYDSSSKTISFFSTKLFLPGEQVTVTLAKGIVSVLGDTMLASYTWSFTVRVAVSSGILTRQNPISVSNSIMSEAVADVDNDLDADLIYLAQDSLIVLTNHNGLGLIKSFALYLGSSPKSIVVGDFDGDGDIDCAVGRSNSQQLSIVKNNGSGQFEVVQSISLFPVQALAAGDFNGDGFLDLAVSKPGATQVNLLKGDNTCSFDSLTAVTVSYVVNKILIGDFDNNGLTDFATISNSQITVSRNQGDNVFLSQYLAFFNLTSTETFTTDINNDGKLDFIGYQKNYYEIQYCLSSGAGAGNIGYNGPYTLNPMPFSMYPYIQGMTCGDVDGDGMPDITFIANVGGQPTLATMKNAIAPKFVAGNSQTLDLSVLRIKSSPFNTNGRMDIAVLTDDSKLVMFQSGIPFPILDISNTSVSFNSVVLDSSETRKIMVRNVGTDTLEISSLVPSNSDFSVFASKITIQPNDSANIDISFHPSRIGYYSDSIALYTNDPVTPFRYIVVYGNGTVISALAPPPFSSDSSTISQIKIEFARDINTATITDQSLIVNGSIWGKYAGTVSYSSQNRTLTFNSANRFRSGEAISVLMKRGIRLTTGDTISSIQWNFISAPLSGSGKFSWNESVEAFTDVNPMLVMDFNKDNFADVLIASYGASKVFLLKNSKNLNFSKTEFSTVNNPSGSTYGDFNNDGLFDIAVISYQNKKVVIMANNGDGTFSLSTTINTPYYPDKIKSSDMDGDGNIDLVVSGFTGESIPSKIILYKNIGGLLFEKIFEVPVYGSVKDMELCDLDGDGDIDISGVTRTDRRVVIIEQKTTNQFQTPLYFQRQGEPSRILCRDFDNDGDADVATLNQSSNNITFLKNNGDMNFGDVGVSIYAGYADSFTASDFDHDGDLDIVVVDHNTSYKYIQNIGGFSFETSYRNLNGNSNIYDVVDGDFDNDGDIDLAFIAGSPSKLYIARNKDTAPLIKLPISSFDFGNTKIDSTKKVIFNIFNDGALLPLRIDSIISSNSAITTSRLSNTVASSESLKVTVQFTPYASGLYHDSISIYSNDSLHPVSRFYVQGVGDEIISVFPHPYSFGAAESTVIVVKLGTTIDEQSLNANSVIVIGSASLRHTFSLLNFNSSTKELTLRTTRPFFPGEKVSVSLTSAIKTKKPDLKFIPKEWDFTVSTKSASGIFVSRSSILDGTDPVRTKLVDLNNDGLLDIVTLYHGTSLLKMYKNVGGFKFTPYASFNAGFGSEDFSAMDFDNDGDVDLCFTNLDSKILMAKNNGDSLFSLSSIEVPGYLQEISAADYDGDGYIDITVGGGSSGGQFSFLKNNGNFSFSVHTELNTTVSFIQSADIDDDGDIDVITGYYSSMVFRNEGNFQFTKLSPQIIGTIPTSFGDLDNDGDNDAAGLVWASGYYGIALNNGDLQFNEKQTWLHSNTNNALYLSDVNGDAKPDALVMHTTGLWTLRNTNGSDFVIDAKTAFPDAPYATAIGDIDNDGDQDAIVASINSDNVIVFEHRNHYTEISVNNLPLNFGKVQKDSSKIISFTISNAGTLPLIVDTIITSNSAFSVVPQSASVPPKSSIQCAVKFVPPLLKAFVDSLSIISNDPNNNKMIVQLLGKTLQHIVDSVSPGMNTSYSPKDVHIVVKFSGNIVPSSLSSSTISVIGSFSGRHNSIVSAGADSKTATIHLDNAFIDGENVTVTISKNIQFQNGDSVLSPFCWSFRIKPTEGLALYNSQAPIIVGSGPLNLTSADLNNDGRTDIIVSNNSSGTLTILKGIKNSSPTRVVDIAVGIGAEETICGDFDNDGRMDIACIADRSVISLKNNNDFSFSKRVLFNNGLDDVRAITAGDLDGDGDIDIIFGCWSQNQVRILRNDGNFNFTAIMLPFVVPNPYKIAVGDFDGDGDLDIVSGSGSSGPILTVLKNNDDLSFEPVSVTQVAPYITTFAIADFDKNGCVDIATINPYQNSLAFLFGSSTMSFTFRSIDLGVYNPRSITCGDFDTDDDLDIAVTTTGYNTAGYIFINDSLKYTLKQQFTAGSEEIINGDFDDDGSIDLAFVRSGYESIGWASNVRAKYYSVSNQSMDFGHVESGKSLVKNLMIYNKGTQPLTMDSVFVESKHFLVEVNKLVLPVLDSIILKITFVPDSVGDFFDTLHLVSTINSIKDIPIQGIGDIETGLSTDMLNIPTHYVLYQNFPNPFNPVTNIKFGVPELSIVTMMVYDIIGREVATLVRGEFAPGYYTYQFNASRLMSGVYFYRISAVSMKSSKSMVQIKKLILVK
ncbi:MAG: FG-GAP-like repeat-containing protein [Bacteroidota bacterium]